MFESLVGADQPAFVRQHRVQDRIILPGTAYLAALADVGRLLRPQIPCAVKDISIVEAMLLEDDGPPQDCSDDPGSRWEGCFPRSHSEPGHRDRRGLDAASVRSDCL